ncbi:MAG: phenylacetate--CoA ligase [Victivallaceae bacterium]|nr:phenylacetate--CoA ligase [Victivallaceae bacterium]
MIWNPEKETLSRDQLSRQQTENLKKLVRQVYGKVPFYRHKMDERGIRPEDIRELTDIVKLPFTTKNDLREVYPLGLLAVDRDKIAEVHTSSGTTGKPVVDAYTARDLDIWSESMARTLSMGGCTAADTVQNAYGYGLFTGGLGVHYGARRIGANIIPISGGNTRRQLEMMQDFGSTILTCTPSYALYIAEFAAGNGIDLAGMQLKSALLGAEPWSENMRREIENKLHLKAYDIYGLTEIIGPGVASECEEQHGLHLFEDHFYPEIINPETGEPVKPGEKGELVITTITKEGTPVLRYRTRDITFFLPGACVCGRTCRRMHRLLGRTDDMLIIRGVNIFPSQVEQVLLRIEAVEPHYQLVIERQNKLDRLEVQVEMNDELFSDEIKQLEAVEKMIERELHSELNVHARVKLVNPKSLPRSEGKAQRVIDRRQLTE